MAFILTDPNSAGPFTTFQIKDIVCKAIKLDYTKFSTSNVDTYAAALPADATVLEIKTWVRTALSGGGVTAPTVTFGTTSGGSDLAAAFSVTNTAGTLQSVSPAVGIMQQYNPPFTQDIKVYIRGSCSTGNPTAGEVDVLIYYVR